MKRRTRIPKKTTAANPNLKSLGFELNDGGATLARDSAFDSDLEVCESICRRAAMTAGRGIGDASRDSNTTYPNQL
jgi:hypothetical protein